MPHIFQNALKFYRLASFFNTTFALFSGRSDQLREEKKGEGNQLCVDYAVTDLWSFFNLACSAVSPKEFEVIAQIKLLQLASNNYSFTPDSHFREWFTGVEKLSEAERLVILNVLFFVTHNLPMHVDVGRWTRTFKGLNLNKSNQTY